MPQTAPSPRGDPYSSQGLGGPKGGTLTWTGLDHPRGLGLGSPWTTPEGLQALGLGYSPSEGSSSVHLYILGTASREDEHGGRHLFGRALEQRKAALGALEAQFDHSP